MNTGVNNALKELRMLKQHIIELLQNNDLRSAEEKINEYSQYHKNTDYYILKATYLFQLGDYKQTLDVLEEAFTNHPYSFEISFNMGIILETIGKGEESIQHYSYAAKRTKNPGEYDACIENIQRVISNIQSDSSVSDEYISNLVNRCNQILNEADGRSYPIDGSGESMVRKVMNKGSQEEFMINMYKLPLIADIGPENRLYHKTELVKGKEVEGETAISLNSPSIVPVSLIKADSKLQIFQNDKEFEFTNSNLPYNRFHYLFFNEPGILSIKSTGKVFIGKPISKETKPDHPKLVLKIFIDGLSYKFLEQHGLQKVMPNTYQFFNEGFIGKNCYATSEWTLPSKASINTGKYSTSHKLLHPDLVYHFEKYNKMMSEYFSETGYYTSKICTNWRTTPGFGYYKGFDRVLYQNFMGGMDCKEVVMEAIEHIEAFKDGNNFLSISIMDLHNVPDEIENNLVVQADTEVSYRVSTNNKGETSVLTKFDTHKILKYYKEIQRVDLFLNVLYDHINKKYGKDEVVVLLHSDHGQTFLEEDHSITHESRRKVPLLMRGKNVPNMVSEELIETVDMLPMMLKACDIALPVSIDGQLPESFGGEQKRDYAITHVIHPNQTYKAAITDCDHIFRFESKAEVQYDLSLNVDDYQVKLLNKYSGHDESDLHQEKINHYVEVIFDHIKGFIKLDS